MAITTYDELKTAVTSWSHRADLSATLPDFIDNAQRKINRELSLGAWEVRSVANTVAGEAYVERPTDSNGIRYIKLNTDPIQVLTYQTPDFIGNSLGGNSTGRPVMFSIVGDEIRLAPTPDSVYELEVSYIREQPLLSDITTTNWVLENAPEMLLYASLVELFAYIQDDKNMAKWSQAYENAKSTIEARDEWIRYPEGTQLAVAVH